MFFFQESIDCFCSAVPNSEDKFSLALGLGSYMNRTKAEVDYYCNKYKPDMPKFEDNEYYLFGDRARLKRKQSKVSLIGKSNEKATFSFTRQSLCLLEKLAVAVNNKEPILIVGETGTGKTSTVQYLAQQTRHDLKVINMNQQSDSTQLLGGFKPVEMKTIVTPIRNKFEALFADTFSVDQNTKFLSHVCVCFASQKWDVLFGLICHTIERAKNKLKDINSVKAVESPVKPGKKKKRKKKDKEEKVTIVNNQLYEKWLDLNIEISRIKEQMEKLESTVAFSFIEGTLVKAIQEGKKIVEF